MFIHLLFVLTGILAGIWLGKASMQEGDDILSLGIPITIFAGFCWMGITEAGQAFGQIVGGARSYPYGITAWDGLALLWLCGISAAIARDVIGRRRKHDTDQSK